MRSKTYYQVRRAVRIAFWISAFIALYLISSRLWWNGGGYCVGSLEVCGL